MKSFFNLMIVLTMLPSAFAEPFCIATYNLNFANRRGDQVLDAISVAKPDLICFQETTQQSERFLKEQLAETYPHFYADGHEGRYHAERFAFASKTELADVKFTQPTVGLFGFYSATLIHEGERIQILNVHLAPVQVRREDGIAAAMSALSEVEKFHSAEIEAITKTIDKDRPTIVLGDFNSVSTFVAPKRLLESGFIDSFASVTKDPDTHPTWKWPTRPVPLLLRIDYIFHSNHFATTKSEVVEREGSDHALVYAILNLNDESDPDGVSEEKGQ